MKSMKESFPTIRETILQTYTCTLCERDVVQKQLEIPFGPYKGEHVIVNEGCRCANIALANEAVARKENLYERQLYDQFHAYSFLNAALKKATFENYMPTSESLQKVKAFLLEYVDTFHPERTMNVLLVGSYGVGKSHLAAAVTKLLLEKGFRCLFMSVPKLLTALKQTYQAKTIYQEADLFQLIEQMDLFVLDDIGAEYAKTTDSQNNWTQAKLFELLDSRAGKPTLFTTNLSSKQLKQKINERNVSRIMDHTTVLKMEGIDYRMKGFVRE